MQSDRAHMSTEISATSDSLLARLTHFFQAYAASEIADRPLSQEARLAAFLDKIRPLLRATAQPERTPAQPHLWGVDWWLALARERALLLVNFPGSCWVSGWWVWVARSEGIWCDGWSASRPIRLARGASAIMAAPDLV